MDQFFCRRLRKRPTASTLVHSKTLQKKRQTMTEKGLDVERAAAAAPTAAEPELAAAAPAAAAAEKNKTLIKLYCPTKVQVKLQIKHQH